MRRFVILCLLALVSGCAGYATGVEGLSAVATQKTLSDHIVSLASGKDCSSVRKEMGLTYCKEDEKTPPMNVYCYNTLGEPTCYKAPVYDGRQDRVQQGGQVPK